MSKMTDSIDAWLLSFDCGKKWLNTITAKRTKDLYSKDMKDYCDAVGKTPHELLKLKPTLVEIVLMSQTGKDLQTINENAAEDLLDNFLYNTEEVTPHMKVSILCAVKNQKNIFACPLNSWLHHLLAV